MKRNINIYNLTEKVMETGIPDVLQSGDGYGWKRVDKIKPIG